MLAYKVHLNDALNAFYSMHVYMIVFEQIHVHNKKVPYTLKDSLDASSASVSATQCAQVRTRPSAEMHTAVPASSCAKTSVAATAVW